MGFRSQLKGNKSQSTTTFRSQLSDSPQSEPRLKAEKQKTAPPVKQPLLPDTRKTGNETVPNFWRNPFDAIAYAFNKAANTDVKKLQMTPQEQAQRLQSSGLAAKPGGKASFTNIPAIIQRQAADVLSLAPDEMEQSAPYKTSGSAIADTVARGAGFVGGLVAAPGGGVNPANALFQTGRQTVNRALLTPQAAKLLSKVPAVVQKFAPMALKGGHSFGTYEAGRALANNEPFPEVATAYGKGFKAGAILEPAGAVIVENALAPAVKLIGEKAIVPMLEKTGLRRPQSNAIDMLGEVNQAYARGKASGINVEKPTLTPETLKPTTDTKVLPTQETVAKSPETDVEFKKGAAEGETIVKEQNGKIKKKYYGPNNQYVSSEVKYIPREGKRELDIKEDGTVVLYADPVYQNDIGALQRTLFRDIDNYLSPLAPDEFIRVQNNPNDYRYLKNKEHKGSTNHAKSEGEGGLSVAKHPEFPAKHAYYVTGRTIGQGADGEPLLDINSAKPISKLMSYEQLLKDFKKRKGEKLKELGLSKEDVRALEAGAKLVKEPSVEQTGGEKKIGVLESLNQKDYPDLKAQGLLKPKTPEGVKGRSTAPLMPNNTKAPPVEPIGTKERRFVSNSMLNAEVVPETMKQEVRKNIPTYVPITNKATWDYNVSKVEADPIQAAREWRGMDSLKTAHDTALGEVLMVKAIKEGNIEEAKSVGVELAERLTEAGQTVQAAAIFKRLTPEGMLLYAQRMVSKVNRSPEILGKIGKKIELTSEDAKYITDQMTKIGQMPEGRPKDVELAKVMQRIADKIPADIVDKSRALRNIALLGNPRTFMRNVTGNVLMGGADTVSNTVGATLLRPLDVYLSKMTGLRSIALPSFKTQAKGFVQGGKEAVSDALGGISREDLANKTVTEKLKTVFEGAANPIDTSFSKTGKWETRRTLSFKNKPMRILENAVNTSLAIGDRPFSQAYYDDVLSQLKRVNKTSTVTPEMEELAQKIAEERTYQDVNTVSALATGIKRLPQNIQNHPKLKNVIQIFVDSLLPYVRTPANILKRGIEYTPVGVIEGLLKLGSFKNAPTLQMQREIIDRISRGLVGTGLLVAGGMASKKGLLTGAPNKDKDVAAFEKSIGKQPYSVKIGDKYYNYDWGQPISMPIGSGVQFAQKGAENSDNLTAGVDAVANALNYYTDQPMLQSLQRFLGSAYDSKSLGQRTLEAALELPKQYIPTVLNQGGQMQDPFQRELYSPNFAKSALINPIKYKLPYARETLPVKLDTLGKPLKSFQGKNTPGNVMLNPGTVTTYKPDAVEQMILDVYNKTGSTEHFPRVPQKYIKIDGKNVDLTPEEYTQLKQIVGEFTRQGFSQIDPQADPEVKIKVMINILNNAGKYGRNYIKQKRGL